MQHFDKGHLPEPSRHFADHLVIQAILLCRVAMEVVLIVAVVFGVMSLV